MNNFINLTKEELSKSIYRIFSIERFLELIKSKKNTFVHPKLWDDPYENLISQVKIFSGTEKNPIVTMFNDFEFCIYGQCWTFDHRNDLLWRSYALDKKGIMLKTTIKKLYESTINSPEFLKLKSNTKEKVWIDKDLWFNKELECVIGKVSYLSKKLIIERLKNNRGFTMEPLFIKRKEFNDEKEFRILIWNKEDYDDRILELNPNITFCSVEIDKLIDEIIFDSRISKELFDAITLYLRNLGVNTKITKLDTYDLPDKINIRQ